MEEEATKATDTQVIAAEPNAVNLAPAKLVKVSGAPLLAEKELFLEWLATIRAERQPQTQTELAALLGVSPVTLSKWKHSSGFMTELIHRVRIRYADRLPGIVAAIGARAEMGDVPAARLFLDFLGMSRKLEIEAKVDETISFEQALKDASENWEPPSWVETKFEDEQQATMTAQQDERNSEK